MGLLNALLNLLTAMWRADRVVFVALGVGWWFAGVVWLGATLYRWLWLGLMLSLVLAGAQRRHLGVEAGLLRATRRWRERLAKTPVVAEASGTSRMSAGPESTAVPVQATQAPAAEPALAPEGSAAGPADTPSGEAPAPVAGSEPEPTHPVVQSLREFFAGPPEEGAAGASEPDRKHPVVQWLGDFIDESDLSDGRATTIAAVEKLDRELRAKLQGQDVAIDVVVRGLKRLAARASLDPHRPLSYLMVGPTGTGKTQIVKWTAEALGRKLLRFDMGNYKDEAGLWQLLGSPQGYVGGEGQLTAAVYADPDAVILFDEIEKGHEKLYDALLALIDEGQVKDRRTGHAIDFSRTIVVLTSNLVTQIPPEVYERPQTARDLVLQTGFLRPEMVNRIQWVVPFRPLSLAAIRQIAARQLGALAERLARERRLEGVTIDRAVVDALVAKADTKYGARDIERLITQHVADPVAETLVSHADAKIRALAIRLRADHVVVENE